MITTYQSGPYNVTNGRVNAPVEIHCLSSDTKPTANIANGSICVEVDTGKVYFFNEAGSAWVEQFSFQE